MKHIILTLAATFAFLTSDVLAGPVEIDVTEAQTENNQTFEFHFNGVPHAYGEAEFILHVRGDFTIDRHPRHEGLDWDIDGVLGDIDVGTIHADSATNQGYNDWEWTKAYTISASDMDAITSDGEIWITVSFNDDVEVNPQNDPFLHLTLRYEGGPINGITLPPFNDVPEPAGLALLGLGAIGLAWHRRRRSA